MSVRQRKATIRFQARPKTAAGPVDILVIRPTGAHWIQRKELHAWGISGRRGGPMLLGDILRKNARPELFGEKTALIFGDRSWT